MPEFDESLSALSWFDESLTDEAWFDDSFSFASSGGGTTTMEPNPFSGGNGIRFGNLDYYHGGWDSSSPPVYGLGFKPSMLDGLAWANHWLSGEAHDANVATYLAEQFDTVETDALDDVDADTTAQLAPTQEWDGIKIVHVSSPRELPPLGMWPRGDRDTTTWEENERSYKQVTYSWAQEPRFYLCPGPVALKLLDPSLNVWTVAASTLPGWSLSQHRHIVDNSEAIDHEIHYDGVKLADVRPWHGFFAVHGFPNTAGTNVTYDVSLGQEHYRAFINDGTVWFSTSPNRLAWVDFDTGLAGEWACVRVHRHGKTRVITLFVEDAGAIKKYESTDQGETWTMATTLSSGSDNVQPCACVSLDGTTYVYWIKGSGPYDIYHCRLDASGAVVLAATAVTGVGNVDLAGIAVDESNVAPGGRRIVLQVIQSGAVVHYVSTDGVAFS